MENVVYVLGAGFSAPLGLPVMSNFLEQANNLYQSNKVEYQHFKRVFQSIKQRLAYVTLFYYSDLTNIEEVLSILEMERLAGNVSQEETEEFIKFIADVIKYFTPTIDGLKNVTRSSKGLYQAVDKKTDWEVQRNIIPHDVLRTYGEFVLTLFNAETEVIGVEGENPDRRPSSDKNLMNLR
jgi:predicted PurR-regulated permease PerM